MKRLTSAAVPNTARRLLTLLALMLSFGIGLGASPYAGAEQYAGAPAFDPLYPPPPYLQRNVNEFMMVVYEADRAAVQALLPPGIVPAPSNSVGVSHYVVREGEGLAPYEATYIYAEVEGFDAPDGSKGRWVLWGLYSPDRVVASLREVIGWPIRLGSTRLVNKRGWLRGAALREENELIISEIVDKGEAPLTVGGVAHYPLLKQLPAANGKDAAVHELLLHRVGYGAKIHMAEPISVTLRFPESHPLYRLRPKKLLYAYYATDVNFSFGDIAVLAR